MGLEFSGFQPAKIAVDKAGGKGKGEGKLESAKSD